MKASETQVGKVFIVGAGPGASDLITLRGLRALRGADVVLYDALVNPELLSEASPEAERIFVGKRCGRHAWEQQAIHREMVAQARAGKTVVRLKGGDPLVFGRGGEEALACEEAGIEFELIPGISSALGAASYAGIPLTHRGVAASVAFVTAHRSDSEGVDAMRWSQLAAAVDTLVIFMGGSRLHGVVDTLLDAGLAAATPIAVVSEATRENQRTVLGTLESISKKVSAAQVAAPMLILVGAVAQFSASLNWFKREKKSEQFDALERPPVDCVETSKATPS